ncbi:MAG: DUF2933 domain-containing protein [Candidatus Rokuibacteriota bacterium]
MGEFLTNYGFFILVALLMVACHLGHGAHGGHPRKRDNDGDGTTGGHRH